MCRCCQSCLEDLYWMCFEEKYGFDKNIANYDPAEDEYYTKNGHVLTSEASASSNEAIVNQPASRLQRNISVNSAKCHQEESRREIQQNVMLAPEILKVFENSQMFNECKVKPTTPQPATFSIGSSRDDKAKAELKSELDSKKLLERLNEEGDAVDAAGSKSTPIIICDDVDEVVLRPRLQRQTSTSNTEIWPLKIVNKNLKNLSLDAPYFTQRPASENDIFTISKGGITETIDRINVLSLTPEVPSISFSHLPKNYLDTPTIDKYRIESPSLLSIQTSEIRTSMMDFSMPRYYRKSDMILNKNLDASNTSLASTSSQPKIHVEKSKRLKTLRTHLPPLMINSNDKFEKAK
ncbi:unnamed protein product [Diamesa tonsa]